MHASKLGGLLLASTLLAGPSSAQILQRSEQPAGAVIARKSGEEALFIEVPSWRTVDINQDVVPGDYLRTNASGSLAVLFSDRTQMRLARNTTLLVKKVGAASDSEFELQSGTIWARAERGGIGLTVDTPAAAAAIRGTDWTMTVDGDKTSLIVLEGNVDFANEFGSVSVAAGESATATIGSAPSKTIVVRSDDREQMQFYFPIRVAFGTVPVSTLPAPAMRAERTRILAKPEAARSADDWLTLAETGLTVDGIETARQAADQARLKRMSLRERARLDLIDATLAALARNYNRAAVLYARAEPALDRERRSVAQYGAFYARSLADPSRNEKPPVIRDGGPAGALAQAITVGFLNDIPAAIRILKEAEARYPNDPLLPAARARFAMLIDDREQTLEAIDRALSLDPDNAEALVARSYYRAGVQGDIEGAYADAAKAVEVEPGDSDLWNALGLAQSARNADREAIAALQRAIELDPEDPLSRANLAIVYLDADRPDLAKKEIDIALEKDPSLDAALVARGRYHIQTGEIDKAVDDLLAGTTANPASAQGLLLLGAAYYEAGQRDAAQQALDNADRLDRNDPIIPNVRTSIAIDEYKADLAIESAQEALRRTRARGGEFAALSANRDAGSTLNSAFRLLGLNAWGRYYGDAVFDPFTGTGFIDQSLAGSTNPFVNNLRFGSVSSEPEANSTAFASQFQGLLLDPQMLAGRSRGANIIRRPFVEATVGGGFTIDNGDAGWNASLEVQGFANLPMPVSVYLDLEGLEAGALRGDDPATGQFDINDRSISGVGFVGFQPTLNDRVIAFVNSRDFRFDLDAIVPATLTPFLGEALENSGDTRTTQAGVAWSHTFGYRNVGSMGLFTTQTRDKSTNVLPDVSLGIPLAFRTDIDTDQNSYVGSVNHTVGVGDVTFRYGANIGVIKGSSDVSSGFVLFPPLVPTTSAETDLDTARVYVDALYEATPSLTFEAGLFGTRLDGTSFGTDVDVTRAEPRVGVAWTPFEGQYLRAGFLREASLLDSATLAPVGVVGLQSNQAQLDADGYTDTVALRWDSEWNSRLFTAVDYQHQEFHGLSIGVPASASSITLTEGTLDRVSATANVWLGGGFGAFGTYAWSKSRNDDATSVGFGDALAFVPEHAARLGLTYVSPYNVKTTLAASYVGKRLGDVAGTELDGYWTADAFLTWEPFDKRFELDLAAYNLFDEKFEVAPFTPGWGRSFVGSFKVRF